MKSGLRTAPVRHATKKATPLHDDGPPERAELPGLRLSTAGEVAVALNVHPSTVRRLARQRLIPFYRPGTALRFDLEEVLRAVRQEAAADPQPEAPARTPRRPGGRDSRTAVERGIPPLEDRAARLAWAMARPD